MGTGLNILVALSVVCVGSAQDGPSPFLIAGMIPINSGVLLAHANIAMKNHVNNLLAPRAGLISSLPNTESKTEGTVTVQYTPHEPPGNPPHNPKRNLTVTLDQQLSCDTSTGGFTIQSTCKVGLVNLNTVNTQTFQTVHSSAKNGYTSTAVIANLTGKTDMNDYGNHVTATLDDNVTIHLMIKSSPDSATTYAGSIDGKISGKIVQNNGYIEDVDAQYMFQSQSITEVIDTYTNKTSETTYGSWGDDYKYKLTLTTTSTYT